MFDFSSLSFITKSRFLTILNFTCKSGDAFDPNNTLYFAG